MSTPLVEPLKSVLESLEAIDFATLCQKYGFDFDSIPADDKREFAFFADKIQAKSKKVFFCVADESDFSDLQLKAITRFVSDCRKMLLDRESFANSKEILSVLRERYGALSGLFLRVGETKGITI